MEDPVQIKFVQLLVAEIVGAVLCFLGVALSLGALAGKTSLLVRGPGFKARLTNASPGIVVVMLGTFLILRALDTEVVRQEVAPHPSSFLERWLVNAGSVKDETSYLDTLHSVVNGEDDIALVKNVTVEAEKSLGELATQQYGEERFWLLLAVANKDRGIFTLSQAKATTRIPQGQLIEVWHVSKNAGLSRIDMIKIAAADREAFYKAMLAMAASGRSFDDAFNELDKGAKDNEIGLAFKTVPVDEDSKTLQDIALRYYGSKRFWRILAWTSGKDLPGGVTGTTVLPDEGSVGVWFLLPAREE